MANPGRTTDHGRRFPVSVDVCPVDLYAPRSPGARLTVTRDTGRAASGRAGSFNSGKTLEPTDYSPGQN